MAFSKLQRAGADLGQFGTGCGAGSREQANTEPLALDGSLDPCRNVQPLFADDLVLRRPVHLEGRRLGHEAEPLLVSEFLGGCLVGADDGHGVVPSPRGDPTVRELGRPDPRRGTRKRFGLSAQRPAD